MFNSEYSVYQHLLMAHVYYEFNLNVVTFTALDAMRKAYEEDLEEEKEKYRVALKTMFTDDYVDEIKKRHE